MVDEEDEELEELLLEKRKRLLERINKSVRPDGEKTIKADNQVDIYVFLTEKARSYLKNNFNTVDRRKLEEAIRFLAENRLIERGLDVDAVAYIARRVLGLDYKIYVEDEGEYKEI